MQIKGRLLDRTGPESNALLDVLDLDAGNFLKVGVANRHRSVTISRPPVVGEAECPVRPVLEPFGQSLRGVPDASRDISPFERVFLGDGDNCLHNVLLFYERADG